MTKLKLCIFLLLRVSKSVDLNCHPIIFTWTPHLHTSKEQWKGKKSWVDDMQQNFVRICIIRRAIFFILLPLTTDICEYVCSKKKKLRWKVRLIWKIFSHLSMFEIFHSPCEDVFRKHFSKEQFVKMHFILFLE